MLREERVQHSDPTRRVPNNYSYLAVWAAHRRQGPRLYAFSQLQTRDHIGYDSSNDRRNYSRNER